MTKVIQFVPNRDLTANENLKAFIELARDFISTWANLDGFTWKGARWPTTHGAIRFLNQENTGLHPSLTPTTEQLLHPQFIDVAKAYIRHRYHTEPHKNIGREMAALRALEYALRLDMGIPDITKVCQRHFDAAVAVIDRRHKAAALIASELLKVVKRLADYNIVTGGAQFWTHKYVGDLGYDKTNGAMTPQEVKDKKLPDQDALLAIGDVFSRGYDDSLEDVDVLITSITAVLLCAPMRINEFLRFRGKCLAHEADRHGKQQYYLKYWVPKTKEYARKPIPETMAEIAIEAIRRLIKITEEGRRLARYMETSPTKFYRHKNCPDVPDDQILSREQLAQALGFASVRSAETYMKDRTGSRRLTGYTLDSLWKIVLEHHQELNPHFPFQEPTSGAEVRPLKMSESLLCCLRHQFSINRNTSSVLLAPFHYSYYCTRLDAREYKHRKNSRCMCFYTRHGFEPKKLKSHSPRHLLNRLAKQSGLSIDVITAWSSRSTYRQTLTYLDNDQGEAAAAAATLMGIDTEQNPKDPVTSEEVEIYGQGPIHRSRYGLCRRSWRVGPCNKFGDCLNCSELLMCKGDRVAAENIAQDRDNLAKTYKAAQVAIERGERSATRWVKVHGPQIKKLGELLSILNDPKIPDGSPIEISGTDFSHEQTLINDKVKEAGIKLVDRSKLVIEYGEDLLACLDELRGPRNE